MEVTVCLTDATEVSGVALSATGKSHITVHVITTTKRKGRVDRYGGLNQISTWYNTLNEKKSDMIWTLNNQDNTIIIMASHGMALLVLSVWSAVTLFDSRNVVIVLEKMGTLIGHVVPGLLLTILGLQHMLKTVRSYYLSKDSGKFLSRFSYPNTNFLPSKLRHFSLTIILIFSLLAITLQLLNFPQLQLSFELDSLEHATMFLHLSIFACLSLYAEVTDTTESLSVVIGLLASSVFGQELFLLRFHSTDHVGLEGHYHWLLQVIVLFSFISAVGMTCCRTSFAAALVLSISVMFQGCWFFNMGLVVWTPRFLPRGCFPHQVGGESGGAVMCESKEMDLRARALANLQFSWILAAILIVVVFVCVFRAKRCGGKCAATCDRLRYQQLQHQSSDVSVTIDGYKQ